MPSFTKEELEEFLSLIKSTYSYDFTHYNYSTLIRRIQNHCIKLNINDFFIYSELILNEKEHFNEMFEYFSINVTEFFREPKQLNLFINNVIPYLQSYSHIKIWCAGCSSGESPYSLAIILKEIGILDKCQIYATDFNNRVLSHAKNGFYDIEDIEKLEKKYQLSGGQNSVKDYFLKQGKYYKIKKNIREKVLFFNHNLVTDGVMNEFHLVICKNVMIYFDKILKNTVVNLFDKSLINKGFLILGQSEYLPSTFQEQFKLYTPKSKIFQKSVMQS